MKLIFKLFKSPCTTTVNGRKYQNSGYFQGKKDDCDFEKKKEQHS